LEKKHILLITYCFTPELWPRAFRCEVLVDFLINEGCKVDILLPRYSITPRPKLKNVKYYETRQGLTDNFLYKNISKNESYKNCGKDNNYYLLTISNIFKKFCSALYNIFVWPDSSVVWYLFAKKELKKMIKNNHYDCIFSSSMPFTTHLLGYYAKKVLKIKWIAEYGDPFSFNPQPSRSIFNFLNKKIENKIIKKMDYIIVPFRGAKDGFLTNYPSLKEGKIKIIPQIMQSLISDPGKIEWKNFDKDKINIVYAGIFYMPIRSPEILLEALIELKKKNISVYNKLRFHIFGNIYGMVEKVFYRYEQLLEDKVILLYGKVSRENCAYAYEKSDYLLNISNNSKYQLPSKLIEYLSFKKTIISLENADSLTPDWSFLIKVNYQIENVVNFFKGIGKYNFQYSFNDYEDIIKQYNADTILNKYFNLIL